eukprot:SAG11_NODE_33883_length_275_cov_0.494318_1_plen_38_part_01
MKAEATVALTAFHDARQTAARAAAAANLEAAKASAVCM